MIETETKKKGKQIERYWTHPEDETINVERDASNWIANVGVKTTFHTTKTSALKQITDVIFIKKLADIPDEDKKSLVKMVEYKKEHYANMRILFDME